MEPFGAFWSLLERSGSLLEPSRAFWSGAFWSFLEWSPPELSGSFWELSGAFWSLLKPSGAFLEPSGGLLGAFKPSFWPLEAFWSLFFDNSNCFFLLFGPLKLPEVA